MTDVPEMVERVARAIMDADPDNFGNSICLNETIHCGDCTDVPMACGVCIADNVRSIAEAAIRAMMEPTETMTESPSYQNGEWSRRNIESYFRSALGED